MISPRLQWCHQIVVTSVCWPKAPNGELSACSNCTRMLGHETKRFIMTPDQFRECVLIARSFLYESPPCPQGRKNKVLGIFGGEPLMSQYFPDYVDILCELVPEPKHRGLWTSVDWVTYTHPRYGRSDNYVYRLLGIRDINELHNKNVGYLNWNMHTEQQACEHHPVLLSISDVIKDEKQKWDLIENCWLNRDWSAAYSLDAYGNTRFYFCEVASAFDRVMKLNIGLPLVEKVWDHDLWFITNDSGVRLPCGVYAGQVHVACTRCGQPLPLRHGRRDLDNMDDVSQSNLEVLKGVKSPMIRRGDYQLHTIESYEQPKHAHYPGAYIKGGYHKGNHVNER